MDVSYDLKKHRANNRLNILMDYKRLKSDNPFALLGSEEKNKEVTSEFQDLIDQFARQLEELVDSYESIGARDTMSRRLILRMVEEKAAQAIAGRVGEPITEMSEEELQNEIDEIEEEYY